MINPFKDVQWQPDLAERRKFARSLVIGFPCVAVALLLIGWWRTGMPARNLNQALMVAGIGGGLGCLFWLIPQISKPFYLAWYFVGCCAGLVISNVIFSVFYLVVFTLFGVGKRLFGKPCFQKGFDPQAKTYWRDVESTMDQRRYYKQY